ncbi:MAG: terminase small subunit [Clostridia bacterium]|nr:terminase small subunit [Clostridia bacterium]
MAETALKPKEERFCLEYIVDYNQTQAAIRAGYAEKSAAKIGCKLMKDSRILARVKELQKEQADRLCLSSDLVVIKLLELVDICMAAKPVMEWSTEAHAFVPSGEYQIDSKGATKALELLGRHLGMFDRKEQASTEGPVYLTGMDEIKE